MSCLMRASKQGTKVTRKERNTVKQKVQNTYSEQLSPQEPNKCHSNNSSSSNSIKCSSTTSNRTAAAAAAQALAAKPAAEIVIAATTAAATAAAATAAAAAAAAATTASGHDQASCSPSIQLGPAKSMSFKVALG